MHFSRTFEQIKDTIRQYNPSMSVNLWAEKCSQDIKNEHFIRTSIRSICDEIVQGYLKESNKGNFNNLIKLNKNMKRKLCEFKLRVLYWDYYRQSFKNFEKYFNYF